MASVKVSEMVEATHFDDNDYAMIVQGNQNKKIKKSNMFNPNFVEQSFTNASCTQNTNNNLAGFDLTAGIWIVVGYFFYNGSDLRTYLTITSNNVEEITTSAYDNSGNVAGHVCGIINVQNTSNIVFNLWPTGKNVIVSGYLKAVRYL